MRAAIIAGLAGTVFAGCAGMPSLFGPNEPMPCGVTVTDVDAWVDRMPMIEPSAKAKMMQVLVETDARETQFRLIRQQDTPLTGGVLTLVLVEGNDGALAGNAVFRERAANRRESVRIVCATGKVLGETDVTVVF